jgi:hypothetical protein
MIIYVTGNPIFFSIIPTQYSSRNSPLNMPPPPPFNSCYVFFIYDYFSILYDTIKMAFAFEKCQTIKNFILFLNDCIEATGSSPIVGGSDCSGSFPFHTYYCILLNPPLAYVKQPIQLVANKGNHMVISVNIHVNRKLDC